MKDKNSISLDLESEEQVRCEYCRERITVGVLNSDTISVSVTKLNTLSGRQHQEPIHICTEHVPAPLDPQDGPLSLVFDTAQRRITGGVVWREGEYPYDKSLPPEQFPDRLLGLAMIVQQALNGRCDI